MNKLINKSARTIQLPHLHILHPLHLNVSLPIVRNHEIKLSGLTQVNIHPVNAFSHVGFFPRLSEDCVLSDWVVGLFFTGFRLEDNLIRTLWILDTRANMVFIVCLIIFPHIPITFRSLRYCDSQHRIVLLLVSKFITHVLEVCLVSEDQQFLENHCFFKCQLCLQLFFAQVADYDVSFLHIDYLVGLVHLQFF